MMRLLSVLFFIPAVLTCVLGLASPTFFFVGAVFVILFLLTATAASRQARERRDDARTAKIVAAVQQGRPL